MIHYLKNISLLENKVNEITEATNSAAEDYLQINASLESLNKSMFDLEGRIAKLSALELNSSSVSYTHLTLPTSDLV